MNNTDRSALLKRMATVLKKYFKATQPEANRSPIEQLVYAICLENASFTAADDVYNALTHNYFDWNEVRVSSSRELAETMKYLPEPAQTGLRLKRTLHYIFDQKYSFDIDEIKRMGAKAYNEYMAKMEFVTPFNSSYVMLTVMGKHAIPVSSGEFEVLDILGLVDKKDREKNSMPWLERLIDKKNAYEFFSLLHQLAALYVKNPYGRKVMEILIAIEPNCKQRIPKRHKTESETETETASTPETKSAKQSVEKQDTSIDKVEKTESKKADVKKTESKKAEPKKVDEKKTESKKTLEPSKPEPKKVVAKESEPKKAEPKKAESKKADSKKTEEKEPDTKKPVTKKAVEKKESVEKPVPPTPKKAPLAGLLARGKATKTAEKKTTKK